MRWIFGLPVVEPRRGYCQGAPAGLEPLAPARASSSADDAAHLSCAAHPHSSTHPHIQNGGPGGDEGSLRGASRLPLSAVAVAARSPAGSTEQHWTDSNRIDGATLDPSVAASTARLPCRHAGNPVYLGRHLRAVPRATPSPFFQAAGRSP